MITTGGGDLRGRVVGGLGYPTSLSKLIKLEKAGVERIVGKL